MSVPEAAQSKWASPVEFAPKTDGCLRFCIEYKKLNAVTVQNSYPPPLTDERMDSLEGARVFSTLNANNGFWQIEVDPFNREKTAFTS